MSDLKEKIKMPRTRKPAFNSATGYASVTEEIYRFAQKQLKGRGIAAKDFLDKLSDFITEYPSEYSDCSELFYLD